MDLRDLITKYKLIYWILDLSKLARLMFLKLYLFIEKNKRLALVPGHLVDQYGLETVIKMIKKHKGKADLNINGTIVKFI